MPPEIGSTELVHSGARGWLRLNQGRFSCTEWNLQCRLSKSCSALNSVDNQSNIGYPQNFAVKFSGSQNSAATIWGTPKF